MCMCIAELHPLPCGQTRSQARSLAAHAGQASRARFPLKECMRNCQIMPGSARAPTLAVGRLSTSSLAAYGVHMYPCVGLGLWSPSQSPPTLPGASRTWRYRLQQPRRDGDQKKKLTAARSSPPYPSGPFHVSPSHVSPRSRARIAASLCTSGNRNLDRPW